MDKTIANCFTLCDFKPKPKPKAETGVGPKWNQRQKLVVTKQLSSDKIPTFEEFTFVDEGVAVTGMLSDDEFVKFLIKAEDSPSDEENQDEKPPDITPKEYKAAVHTLRMFQKKSVMHQTVCFRPLF